MSERQRRWNAEQRLKRLAAWWRYNENPQYVPKPLTYQERLTRHFARQEAARADARAAQALADLYERIKKP